jgi:hypothetical protein
MVVNPREQACRAHELLRRRAVIALLGTRLAKSTANGSLGRRITSDTQSMLQRGYYLPSVSAVRIRQRAVRKAPIGIIMGKREQLLCGVAQHQPIGLTRAVSHGLDRATQARN